LYGSPAQRENGLVVPRIDSAHPRLFVDAPLRAGLVVGLTREQSNYLLNVLRLGEGASLLVFNGRDGEWRARIAGGSRKSASLAIEDQSRPQESAGNVHLMFAPLKHARLDYMVQKAVEMGVCRLQPMITRHTQVARLNSERMRANAIEAAEQCGLITLPDIGDEQPMARLIAAWPEEQLLIFCDEESPGGDPLAALIDHRRRARTGAMALIIGPEGGFHADERSDVLRRSNCLRLSLGPRILRADTAAVAALALVQAVLGDWRRL
jgi:16S rRNA (uracil1498-N3)-methyltransferase